jgi:putative DNA primase/helicase
MAEAGLRAKAGQSIRVIDIPVDRPYGLFDDLKGFASGSILSETIKFRVQRQHGFVGRELLERLTLDTRDFSKLIEQFKALPEFSRNVSGQEKRAANRFALVALAGELATEYGLTGWQEDEAFEAAALMFSLWLGQRGKEGNSEQHDLIQQLSDFLERHGGSRFEPHPNDSVHTIRDRAGWITRRDGEAVYLFNSNGIREALKGHDFKRALTKLHEVGLLPKDKQGKHSVLERIGGSSSRVYPIIASQLARCLYGD